MKYLGLENIEQLNAQLSGLDIGDSLISCRLEAYTLKNTHQDKKLLSHIESKYKEQLSLSTSVESNSSSLNGGKSPVGQFMAPRKTLFYLLATLNAAFPDYDFSDLKPIFFVKIPSLSSVVHLLKTQFFHHLTPFLATESLESLMWNTIDEAVTLEECDFYFFEPDKELEPDASEEPPLWSLYTFFFNKKLKRMVFFTAKATSFLVPGDLSTDSIVTMEPNSSQESLSYSEYVMDSVDI